MSTPKDGGPAFPHPSSTAFGPGMSLRDWFAGQAIAGLCADPSNHKLFADKDEAAVSAYAIADVMLAERAKGGKP